MPKDRLAALKKAIAEVGVGDEEGADDRAFLLEHTDRFMEDFFQQTEGIRKMIEGIAEQGEEVKKKHSILLSFPQTDKKTKAEAEHLMQDIKKKAKEVRTELKAMEDSIKKEEQTKGSLARLRIRQNQYRSLHSKFEEVVNDFNTSQAKFMDLFKARLQRQLDIAGRKITDEELQDMIDTGKVAIHTHEILTETQQARQTVKETEARQQDLQKLESSVRELHDLFTTVALHVDTQGETLNRVECNVASAAEHVKTSQGELKKAVIYQSKARRKKVMLLIMIAIIVIVAIIAVIVAVAA